MLGWSSNHTLLLAQLPVLPVHRCTKVADPVLAKLLERTARLLARPPPCTGAACRRLRDFN